MTRSALILAFIVSAACSGDPVPTKTVLTRDASTHSLPPKSTEKPHPRHYQRALMGTPFTILIDDDISERTASQAANAAFGEVDRVEALMSEWIPSSEVSAINRKAGKAPVQVSVETFRLIEQSLQLSKRSVGAFDITWAAYRGLWNFRSPGSIPTEAQRRARRPLVGWHKVKLNRNERTVYLTTPGSQIGLGGIAKGYGIDRAAQILRQHGLKRFLVNGGGDLYGTGKKRNGSPWQVGVQHPRKPGRMVTKLPVDGASIVSSGDYERSFERDGKRYHHILDLKTGLPSRQSIAVTVRATTATLADALATAVFVMGPDKGIELIGDTPGAEAAVLCPDGRVEATQGLRHLFPKRWDHR